MSDDKQRSNKRLLTEVHDGSTVSTTAVKPASNLSDSKDNTDIRDVTNKTSIRLLLAVPNGAFPYLPPTLAERHFGKFGKEGSNQLWLGVAVRDACVVPTFGNATNGTNTDKNSNNSNNNNKKKKDNNTNSDNNDYILKKPTGYSISFTASIKSSCTSNKDETVSPLFTHVTLPSFDLLQEEIENQLLLKQPKPKRSSSRSPTPLPPSTTTSTAVSNDTSAATTATDVMSTPTAMSCEATNRHIMVWTPHGRQLLTPNQYQLVADGLDSSYTLSLYDQCHPHVNSRRRRQMMKRRNEEWLQHIMRPSGRDNDDDKSTDREGNETLSPPSIPSNSNNANYIVPWVLTNEEPNEGQSVNGDRTDTTLETLSLSLQQHSNVVGVALIGWPHLTLQEQEQRPPWLSSFLATFQETNLAISNQQPSRDLLRLMVLETRSLSHVINATELGATVIGTSLPMTWAQQHKAFVLDFENYASHKTNTNDDADNSGNTEHDAKRPRLDQSMTNEEGSPKCDENGCWDMSQKVFQLDQRPLVQGCTCFACRGGAAEPSSITTHSKAAAAASSSSLLFHSPTTPPTCRAYVHHLFNTQELLGEMLLFAHNLHHMLRFLQHASENIRPEEFSDFRQYLLDQLPKPSL